MVPKVKKKKREKGKENRINVPPELRIPSDPLLL
jgi:hypothetical protein